MEVNARANRKWDLGKSEKCIKGSNADEPVGPCLLPNHDESQLFGDEAKLSLDRDYFKGDADELW